MTTHCADIFTEEKGIQETKGSHIKKNKRKVYWAILSICVSRKLIHDLKLYKQNCSISPAVNDSRATNREED